MEDRCPNVFSARILLTQYQALAVTIFNSITMILTFASNIMVTVSLFGAKQLDSKVNRMFLGLSICDICVAVIVQPLTLILFTLKQKERSCQLELVTQSLSLFFAHSSAFFIVAIGIERFVSVKDLNLPRDTNNISYRRIYAFMTVCVMMAATVAVAMTLSSLHQVYSMAHIILLIVDLCALISVYTAYIETYRVVIRHAKETKFLRANQSTSPSYTTAMVKAIMLIIFFLFISYIPYLSSGIVLFHETQVAGKSINATYAFITYFTNIFVYLNSFFNAVIVLSKNKALLRYLKERFHSASKRFVVNPTQSNKDNCFGTISLNQIRPGLASNV